MPPTFKRGFILIAGLVSLLGCVDGDFSLPVTAKQERDGHQELVKFLETVNLAETKEKAEANNPQAQVDLALMHILGVQVEADFDEGLSWLKKAEAQKDTTALYNLGIAYLKGVGDFDKDWRKAHMYMNIACTKAQKEGSHDISSYACANRTAIEDAWGFLVRSRRAEAQELALNYMKENFGSLYVFLPPGTLDGAKVNIYPYARYFIGNGIHMGTDCPQHDVSAYYWYKKSLGTHPDAQNKFEILKTRMSQDQIERAEKMAAEMAPENFHE